MAKYRSKIKRLPLPSFYSQFFWSPSTCLYPNDCFYFDPDKVLTPLPELIFKTRFSYSRFKNGRPHFRHSQSQTLNLSASTIIKTPSTDMSHIQECLERIVGNSPLRTIEQLNDDFEFLNLGEKLDLEEELFQYKNGATSTRQLRLEDSESPISRISGGPIFIDVKGLTDSSSSQIESFADLALESPFSRSSRKLHQDRSTLGSQMRSEPRSRCRTLSPAKSLGELKSINDAATQTSTDFEDSFGQRTIATQTSD